MLAYMFSLGWGDVGGVWKWQRILFAWEKKLVGKCCGLRLNVFCRLTYQISGNGGWTE